MKYDKEKPFAWGIGGKKTDDKLTHSKLWMSTIVKVSGHCFRTQNQTRFRFQDWEFHNLQTSITFPDGLSLAINKNKYFRFFFWDRNIYFHMHPPSPPPTILSAGLWNSYPMLNLGYYGVEGKRKGGTNRNTGERERAYLGPFHNMTVLSGTITLKGETKCSHADSFSLQLAWV